MTQEVVLVHDYLNQRGGAERVVLELARMFPQAPIYTSLYKPGSTFPEFAQAAIHTTFLDRLAVDKGFRTLFPAYPAAFRSMGTLDADLVISSSSGWAHAVRTRARAFHAVYCYTPARWLYGSTYQGASRGQALVRPLLGGFRRWDRRAAIRADLYIAISTEVRKRIAWTYGRDAPVVYPPVDTARFSPRPRGERLLVVSRLLPYKRVDLIVDAATQAGVPLDVVGAGPALADLRARAGGMVTFHGRLEDQAITELFESCRAFCLPGAEDFGITPVEAQAAGKPVVAFAAGGALETIEDGVSGVLFHEQTPEAVRAALVACDELTSAPEQIAALAERFSVQAFRESLTRALAPADRSMHGAAG